MGGMAFHNIFWPHHCPSLFQKRALSWRDFYWIFGFLHLHVFDEHILDEHLLHSTQQSLQTPCNASLFILTPSACSHSHSRSEATRKASHKVFIEHYWELNRMDLLVAYFVFCHWQMYGSFIINREQNFCKFSSPPQAILWWECNALWNKHNLKISAQYFCRSTRFTLSYFFCSWQHYNSFLISFFGLKSCVFSTFYSYQNLSSFTHT